MKVLSTRRITNDRRHNAFTGACWFKGDLYVGYRQADIHYHEDSSRVIVQRSRDAGVTWDTVAVLRGYGDTRDAHLYTDGSRLYGVHLGYDGPVEVWWNGREVFEGPGSSPAVQDTTSLRLESKHGTNRLALALDTRQGEARGIYARWERTWES